jgi:hypothetical protein
MTAMIKREAILAAFLESSEAKSAREQQRKALTDCVDELKEERHDRSICHMKSTIV